MRIQNELIIIYRILYRVLARTKIRAEVDFVKKKKIGNIQIICDYNQQNKCLSLKL